MPGRDSNKVIPIKDGTPPGGGGGGDDGGIYSRVGRLEGELKHLATKKDVSDLQKWVLGEIIIGIILIVGSIFGSIKYILEPLLKEIIKSGLP